MLSFVRKKGQGISGEYVLIITMVAISIGAMSVYVRRTLQGRYRDANRMVYMKASGTLGQPILAEYEPYYVDTAGKTDARGSEEAKTIGGGVISKETASLRNTNSISVQRPF